MDLSTDEPIAPAIGPAAPPVVARTDDRVWKVLAATAAVVLIGFVVYVVTRPHHPRAVASPTTPAATLPLGTPAPDFSLTRLGGGPPVALAATRGMPTVVNFFASWCPDCRSELAAFAALADRTAGHVDVIGVDSNDNDGAAARTLLAEAQATYPVGLDPDANVATSYLLNALPVTYFLDRRGRVVHVAFGTQTPESLARWTDSLTRPSATTGSP